MCQSVRCWYRVSLRRHFVACESRNWDRRILTAIAFFPEDIAKLELD